MPRITGVAGLAEALYREPDEQGDEQGLQDTALGQGREQRVGNDALDEVDDAAGVLGLLGVGVAATLGGLQALAGVDDVPDAEADRQGEGRHGEEVRQGDAAGLAHGCRSSDRPDAQDDRAEDDRSDHHPDEVDEHRAQRFKPGTEAREGQPDEDAEEDRDDHGDVQPVGAVPSWRGGFDDVRKAGFRVGRHCRSPLVRWTRSGAQASDDDGE